MDTFSGQVKCFRRGNFSLYSLSKITQTMHFIGQNSEVKFQLMLADNLQKHTYGQSSKTVTMVQLQSFALRYNYLCKMHSVRRTKHSEENVQLG